MGAGHVDRPGGGAGGQRGGQISAGTPASPGIMPVGVPAVRQAQPQRDPHLAAGNHAVASVISVATERLVATGALSHARAGMAAQRAAQKIDEAGERENGEKTEHGETCVSRFDAIIAKEIEAGHRPDASLRRGRWLRDPAAWTGRERSRRRVRSVPSAIGPVEAGLSSEPVEAGIHVGRVAAGRLRHPLGPCRSFRIRASNGGL